jgi:exopolysaccharide biosynthesis polyprenyl glycosylphosphotransferase
MAVRDETTEVEAAGAGDLAESSVGDRQLTGSVGALARISPGHGASSVTRRRGWLVRRSLMWSDAAGLTLAFVCAEAAFRGTGNPSLSRFDLASEFALFFLLLPLWIVVAQLHGLYDRDESRANHSTADDVAGVFGLVTVGAWFLLLAAWLTHLASPAYIKVVMFWAFAIVSVTLARVAARSYCRRQPAYVQNAVIVGAGEIGQFIARRIEQHPEYGINLLGFVDDRPKQRHPDLSDELTLLGPSEDLHDIVSELDVERVIIAFSEDPFERLLELVRSIRDLEVQVDIVPRFFDLVSPSSEIHLLEGVSLIGLPPLHLSRSSRRFKRLTDVVFSAVALLVLAPLLALIAIAIKLDSPGRVLFRQRRIGAGGRAFAIIKFRTMTTDAEDRKRELAHLNKHANDGHDTRMFKIPGDPRATRVGRVLRRYSLDELPQFVNVLRGDMSLVGPRPLIPDEDRQVADWGRKRLDLRPGMTGLWQVLGRSDIPFEEMVKLDYQYVTSWSLGNDLRLLLRTIPLVFTGRGGSY